MAPAQNSTDRADLHRLGLFVHGALFALHSLGLAYNILRHNNIDSLIHIMAGTYSLRAAFTHHDQLTPQ